MRSETRQSFENRPHRMHGDFWNPDQLAFAAFRDPAVQAYRCSFLGSGMWADVTVLIDGRWTPRRLHRGQL